MSNIEPIVEQYLAIWTEQDHGKRRALVEQVFAEDAILEGPFRSDRGHDGITAFATEFFPHVGAFTFKRSRPIDRHHDNARWTWEIYQGPNQPVFAAGLDVARIAPDGRLQSVTQFLDVVPEAAGEHGEGHHTAT